MLSTLGLTLWLRYGVSGVVAEVDEGVRYCQEAADSCPPSDAARPGILANLANGLLRRFNGSVSLQISIAGLSRSARR